MLFLNLILMIFSLYLGTKMLLGLVRLFIIKISELPEEYHISHCMLRYFQNGNRIALLHLYCIFNIASYRIIEGIDRPLMLNDAE